MQLTINVNGDIFLLNPGVDYELKDGTRRSYEEILTLDDPERSAFDIAWLVDPPIPESKVATGFVVELVDGVPTRVATLVDRPVEERKTTMLSSLAAYRWQREIGGAHFGMVMIGTDDRSKLLAFAARTKAKENSAYTKRWKVGPGQYADLDATHLILLADAIEAHTATCFEHEEALAALVLAAATHGELDAIDLYSGWPE